MCSESKCKNCSLTGISFKRTLLKHMCFCCCRCWSFVFKFFKCDYTNAIKLILLCLTFEDFCVIIFVIQTCMHWYASRCGNWFFFKYVIFSETCLPHKLSICKEAIRAKLNMHLICSQEIIKSNSSMECLFSLLYFQMTWTCWYVYFSFGSHFL